MNMMEIIALTVARVSLVIADGELPLPEPKSFFAGGSVSRKIVN
ncbi:hypothetical protein [Bacillus sp. DNRA2]|nr:hypothetical protein [Bacillus sp. DNRA2]